MRNRKRMRSHHLIRNRTCERARRAEGRSHRKSIMRNRKRMRSHHLIRNRTCERARRIVLRGGGRANLTGKRKLSK